MSTRPARASPVSRRRVLVDASAYFALAERRETRHQEARAIANALQVGRWQLLTTNFIIAEAHALFLARMGRDLAAHFLTGIRTSGATTIVRATEADEERAFAIITAYRDKEFSFTDAISFAVIERLGIGYTFAFDRHFAQYGLSVLSPNQAPLR